LSLGLRVTVPVGWRADRGERDRTRGEYDRSLEDARAQRLALEVAVRAAHREAELSRQSLAVMQSLLEAAREQARIARLEYEAGRTTAYEAVNLEAELARAEFRVSQMLVRVGHATSELKRLTTGAAGESTP
jgi:outer membrane protein TolC